MSLDKAIDHGKEKRKKYRGSKAVDHTCRNHGSCEWCRENRLHKFKKAKMRGDRIMGEKIVKDEIYKNYRIIVRELEGGMNIFSMPGY